MRVGEENLLEMCFALYIKPTALPNGSLSLAVGDTHRGRIMRRYGFNDSTTSKCLGRFVWLCLVYILIYMTLIVIVFVLLS